MTTSLVGQNESASLHLAAMLALTAGALSLGFAGLIPVPVCVLTVVLILVMGLAVPRWTPQFRHDSPQRTVLALAVLGLLVAATAGSGPGALFSGQLSGALNTAVAELALPAGVPIGLLAALAAGALVAVALELAERRGIQSALVLGIAVLGLASVAAPGWHLLPGLILGWPATLFALTKLAGSGASGVATARTATSVPDAVSTPARSKPTDSGDAESEKAGSPTSRFKAATSRAAGSKSAGSKASGVKARSSQAAVMHRNPPSQNRNTRIIGRWAVLPISAAITVSLVALLLAKFSGALSDTPQAGAWTPGSSNATAGGNRATSDYLGGDMNLSARGTLGPEPVLEVTDSSPSLWRAGTLDQYTGRGWLTSQPPNGVPTLTGDDANSGVVTVDPAPTSTAGTSRTDQVRTVRPGATQVLSPGQLISLTAASLSTGGSAFVSPGDRVTLIGGSGVAERYTVRSQVAPTVDDASASTRLTSTVASIARPGTAGTGTTGTGTGTNNADTDTTRTDHAETDDGQDARWLDLPSTVPARVHQLATTLVTSAPSRLAAVRAVEAELDRRMTYNLDSPVPPRGADAVDDVLFVSHSGFCEQFATAEVVLLRSAGVPARMAVGFSGGEDGGDGFRTMRRSDAHAWVEVWFPEVGWVTSDPTPAASSTTSWWQSFKEQIKDLFANPWTWIVAALVLALVTALVLVVRRRRSRSSGPAADPSHSIDPDLAAAFARLEAGLLAEGRPRTPNETVAALGRRLGRTPSGAAPVLTVLPHSSYASIPGSESPRSKRHRPIWSRLRSSRSSEARPSDSQTFDSRPSDLRSPDSRPYESQTSDLGPPGSQPSDPRSSDPQRSGPRMVQPRPSEPPLSNPGPSGQSQSPPSQPESVWRERTEPATAEPLDKTSEETKSTDNERKPLSRSALVQALEVLERALYAPSPPSRSECLAAATAIDQHGVTTPGGSR